MKILTQKHVISAPVDEVYIALTNPFTIELWSGYEAEMSTTPGSEFSLWEGDIVGKNLEFEENKLIKQQWYFDGQEEESIVTLTLLEKGDYTHVELSHINIPDEAFEEMKEGWKDHYFDALKKFFK
jgi:activator of HSP90 ATPase